MNNSVNLLVSHWLRLLKISVSDSYLKQQLLSHPDYPSLLSITDTLNDLDIENTALEISKENLHRVPVPFLAHLHGKFDEFVVISKRNDLEEQFCRFFKRWSGVVVLAAKKENWVHKTNAEWLRTEKQQKMRFVLFLGLFLAFGAISIFYSFEWQKTILVFVAAAGIFFSWLIVSKDLGIENRLADQVCGRDADCNEVLHSKGAKLPLGVRWSDIGMIYFCFLMLLLLFSPFARTNGNFYAILSPLAISVLPLTLLSIYYQLRIVKKWCRLCLIIVCLLWIQFATILDIKKGTFDSFEIGTVLSIFVLFLVVAGWFLIKALFKENRKLETENYAGKRFRNNPDVFKALLERQKKVDTTAFENDLQLGNPDASLQILVACSPYCWPCAKTHEVLHALVEKYDIGLTVRFTVKTGNNEDKKFKASEYIIRLVKDEQVAYKRNALCNWYKEMNLDKFSKLYSLYDKDKVGVSEIINQYEIWSEEARIQYTPTIFINGYELPLLYKAEDLKILIRGITEEIKTPTTELVMS